jgi:hypothetical protein
VREHVARQDEPRRREIHVDFFEVLFKEGPSDAKDFGRQKMILVSRALRSCRVCCVATEDGSNVAFSKVMIEE